jgi:hypothetical protein
MTYLELCQAVRSRAGIQGSGPATVVATTDVEKDIVQAVRDAWLDIQNYRQEWDWMRASAFFNLVIGQKIYSKDDIGGVDNRIDKYVQGSLWLYDGSQYSRLNYRDEDIFEYFHKNDIGNFKPWDWTINRYDESVEIQSPDQAYAMTIDYWKTPQILSNDTDVPEIDPHWHNLIIYLALEKLGASILSQAVQAEAAQSYAEGMGQLMRRYLKKKRVMTRGIA